MRKTEHSKDENKTKSAEKSAAREAADIFAKNGKAIITSGMSLVLDRIRFAKNNDACVREAIKLIEDCTELKAQQKKDFIDKLKHASVMDTEKLLSLVVEILERLCGNTEELEKEKEIIVSMDEQVRKWAQ